MARPPHRRPGQSRRAQLGLFAGSVVAIVGVVAGLLLALLSLADPIGFGRLRLAANEAVAPVARLGRSAVGSLSGLDDAIGAHVRAARQNRQLRAQLTQARRKLVATSALAEENRQLRALLDLRRSGQPIVVASRLLSSTSGSARRIAILDAGSARGVRAGQAVRAADGLIGRVLDAGPSVARVLLLSDAESVVPARRGSDGLPALVTGLMTGDLQVRAATSGNNPFRVGDLLLTSGTGGLYQPNIPIAIVVRRTRDGAVARPLAQPAQAEAVVVLPVFDLPDPGVAEAEAAEPAPAPAPVAAPAP